MVRRARYKDADAMTTIQKIPPNPVMKGWIPLSIISVVVVVVVVYD
jgi:hypothetical protein